MKNIQTVGRRNKINAVSRRYNLSEMISESYNLLYECKAGSKMYRLVESHIANIRNNPNPNSLTELSEDLSVLKGLVAKKGVVIRESDIPVDTQEFTDEMSLKKKNLGTDTDVSEMDDPDLINEDEEIDDEDLEEDEDLEDEELEEDEDCEDCPEETLEEDEEEEELEEDEDFEDEELEEDEDEEFLEEDEEEELEEDEDEISDEELQELKKHLKEMRKARKIKEARRAKARKLKESKKSKKTSKKTSKKVRESVSWSSEKSSMSVALKHFRESSTNKAFYNTFAKMNARLKNKKPLTLQESILLYKASNSAMTQLAVELEHNPDFIYTFKECTKILSKDTKSLLECIRSHKAPSKSLVASLRTFSNILLESEEVEDYEDYEEEVVENTPILDDEQEKELQDSEDISSEEELEEEEGLEDEETLEEDEDEEEVLEEDDEEEETLEEDDDEEETLEEDEDEEELEEEEDPSEEDLEEDEDVDDKDLEEDDDSTITDEEAEELKKKLVEIRSRKRKKK